MKLPLKAAWQWEAEGLLVAMAIRKPQGWRNHEEMRISMAAVEISLVFLIPLSHFISAKCVQWCARPLEEAIEKGCVCVFVCNFYAIWSQEEKEGILTTHSSLLPPFTIPLFTKLSFAY